MYNVLLVDDEILVREAISENIKWNSLGFNLVGTCQNGKEAIEFIEKNHVDVVLTDICMPILDGMELIKYTYDNFPDISVIIFSGFDEFEYAQKAIKYNVEDYILKPVTAAELSKVLTATKKKRDKRIEQERNWEIISKSYNKNKIYIKSKLLIDFITGKTPASEITSELENFNIELSEKYYRVAIVELKRINSYSGDEEQMKQYSSLMLFSVYNISEEILVKNKNGIVCMSNNDRLYILFKSNYFTEIKTLAKALCTDIKNKAKDYLNTDISITIGKTISGKDKIYKSYESAHTSIKYQYILGEYSVIDSEQAESLWNNKSPYIDLETYISKLAHSIVANDENMIGQLSRELRKVLESSFHTKTLTISYLQRVVLDLNDDLNISYLVQEDEDLDKEGVLADIARTHTLSEAIDILNKYFEKIVEALINQKGSTNRKRALLATDYIEKNYSDPKLSLSEVCSYLNISSSRFSTIFKDEIGETFMEFLTRTRIEKSKVLLETSDLKNYEIASKVGFSDPQYFSVVFKKMTRQSPTEYSRKNRKILNNKGMVKNC
ncbi:MAG: response regulator [Clostridiales bacterium]|nr:response regulator [Clostridiales bacterium]